MKFKNIILGLGLSLLMNTTFAQGGLEGIVVERYYQTNAADGTNASTNSAVNALATGSVVYRVYVDMAAGYKFSQLYGATNHSLKLNTTTNFYNDPNNGTAYGPGSTSLINAAKNTVLIDSWFTVGGVCAGKSGVLKTEDSDGSIGNTQGVLANNPGSCYGSPINGANAKDGLVPSTAASGNLATTFANANSMQVLGLNTQPNLLNLLDQGTGNSLTTSNFSIGSLGGVRGASASNMVLVGQFTTNGVLSFELNVQIIAANGTAENWVARNPTGNEFTSPSLIFNSTPIAGTVSTAAISVCTGSSNLLTLTGSSGTIQWQRSTTSSQSGFSDISGANLSTFNATNLTTTAWYRAKVSKSSCAEVFTPAVKVTVTNVPSIGGTLSSNVSICKNSSTNLTLTGSSGTISWQYSTNWTSVTPTWLNVSGQTSASLSTGALTTSRAYRAKLTSGSCISYSNQVVVTVSPTSAVSSISGHGTFCAGSNVNLTIASATGTIQWQESPTSTGTFTNIVGANGLTYTITNLQSTRSYRVVVTSGACSSIISSVRTVICASPSVGGTITSNRSASVCSGTNTTFTLTGSTGTRQWQSSSNGVDFTDMAGFTGATAQIIISSPIYLRAKLTSGTCSAVYSNVLFTDILPVALGGLISGENSVMINTGTTLSVAGSQGLISWQSSTDGITFTTVVGQNSTSLITGNLAVSTSYRVRAKVGTCIVYSPVFTVTVNSPRTSEIDLTSFGVKAYPNPFDDDFKVEVNTSTDEAILVNVYDMLGKLVENHQVNVSDLSTFVIGDKFVSGVYNIEVIQGTQFERLRVVKN
jgi:hypothetical protein